jgi:hypothetical protein
MEVVVLYQMPKSAGHRMRTKFVSAAQYLGGDMEYRYILSTQYCQGNTGILRIIFIVTQGNPVISYLLSIVCCEEKKCAVGSSSFICSALSRGLLLAILRLSKALGLRGRAIKWIDDTGLATE